MSATLDIPLQTSGDAAALAREAARWRTFAIISHPDLTFDPDPPAGDA